MDTTLQARASGTAPRPATQAASASTPLVAIDSGLLVLRLALGVMILMHGIAKLAGGPGFIEGMLANAGLPTVLAYGVYVGEVIAPLMLIVGWQTRIGAAIIAFNMVVAIGLVHLKQVFTLNQMGGWSLELQGMFLFAALALALTGAGRYAWDALHPRRD